MTNDVTTEPTARTTVDAPFDILDWQEEPYDEPANGPRLTRVSISKRYHGPIEGSGVAHVLTTQGDRGAGYIASERVVGSIDGRSGSFVIQHGGLMDDGEPSTWGTIVPHSGTGDLAGIRGEAAEMQHEVLTLTYWFEA